MVTAPFTCPTQAECPEPAKATPPGLVGRSVSVRSKAPGVSGAGARLLEETLGGDGEELGGIGGAVLAQHGGLPPHFGLRISELGFQRRAPPVPADAPGADRSAREDAGAGYHAIPVEWVSS